VSSAKELFLQALELPEDARPAFVEQQCGGDEALRVRVGALLAAHGGSDARFGADAALASAAALRPGDHVAGYTLVDVLGEGGFATVWRAQQSQPVRRFVALKVLKAGMDTAEVVARFRAEQQALALMDHPSIATVFDGGATDHGRPWFAMELVDGLPITTFCERRELPLEARLRLFARVCRAVQHAHTKGVVHRDLKPSNVLVTEVDGDVVPKVIDFGIAKAVERRLTDDSVMTREGQLVGTPAYMSPEQLDERGDVDTRCDVYALGVLLYELVCAARPFGDDTLRDQGLAEVLRVIREVQPPPPSARASDRERARALRGDLDWIVMRCLEKDRARRYDSADVLANEIERFLADEPVLAGPPELGYRMRKFVGRHATALTVAAMVLVVLVCGIVVSLSQMLRAEAAEQRTSIELDKYEQLGTFYEFLLTGVDPAVASTADTTLLRRMLADADAWAQARFVARPEVEAVVRRAIGNAYLSIARDDLAEPQLRRALSLRQEVLPEGDPDVAESMRELAVLLKRTDRLDEAAPLLDEAVVTFERALGPDDARTLRARGDVAAVLHERERFAEAEAVLRDVERRALAALGERHEVTITILNNLGNVLEHRGQLREAGERYERALALQLENDGALHPKALMTLNNVASVLRERGELPAAAELLQRALALKRRVFEPGHPSLVVALNNLGQTWQQLERYAEAAACFGEALAMVEASPSNDPVQVLKLRFNHASLLAKAEQRERALPLFARCAEAADELWGTGHHLAANFHSAHGWQLVQLGRAADAEPILRAALASSRAGGREVDGAVTSVRLGVCLRDLGRRSGARELLEGGLAGVQRHGLEAWIDIAERALRSLDG